MNKTIFLVATIVALASCGRKNDETTAHHLPQESKGPNQLRMTKAAKSTIPSIGKQNGCKILVINNRFSNNIIDVVGISKFGIIHLSKPGFKTSFVTSKNTYDPAFTDTTYTITSGNSWLEIKNFNPLNTKSKIPIWIDADIRDNNISTYNGVFIGMPKAKFLKLIGAKYSACDTIKVDTDEQSCNNYFVFSNDSLRHIILTSSAD